LATAASSSRSGMNLVSERAFRIRDDMETAVNTIRLLCNLQAKGVLGERARIHTNSQLNCSDE
jgi:hypothetical protein